MCSNVLTNIYRMKEPQRNTNRKMEGRRQVLNKHNGHAVPSGEPTRSLTFFRSLVMVRLRGVQEDMHLITEGGGLRG